jgi:hypothetical protein
MEELELRKTFTILQEKLLMSDIPTVSRAELEAQFTALQAEYQEHMEELRFEWVRQNNTMRNHPDCYEVMRDQDRERVHGVMQSYNAYITPIAEKWWKDRGWTIQWPTADESRCSYTKD